MTTESHPTREESPLRSVYDDVLGELRCLLKAIELESEPVHKKATVACLKAVIVYFEARADEVAS